MSMNISRLRFEPRPFCTWVQHTNYSATEPPWWFHHPWYQWRLCSVNLLQRFHIEHFLWTACIECILWAVAYWNYDLFNICCSTVLCFVVSALTLLVGHQEQHSACKNWVMGCCSGYLSGARCRLLAYGPAEAVAIPKPHYLLPHLNPDWCYLSATGLPRLYWKRGR